MFLRELRTSLLTLVAVMVVGVVGFRTIEGWTWLESLWMAVITLTTIGFGEIHPLSDRGRVFTLLYILLAVGAATYAVAQLTGYVLEGGLARAIRARRRESQMRELREHYIVVGFGRLGREVAEDLRHEGARVVVIDPKPQVADLLPEGVFFVLGDGSSDAVLREAGVERARAVAVATPSSAVNVFVTLSVRQLNASAQIITRVDEPEAEPKALRAGANTVISPFVSAGNRMSHQLLHPTPPSSWSRCSAGISASSWWTTWRFAASRSAPSASCTCVSASASASSRFGARVASW